MDSKGIRVIKALSLRKVLGYIQDRQSNPKAIWQQAVIFHKEMDEGALWRWAVYGQEWLLFRTHASEWEDSQFLGIELPV